MSHIRRVLSPAERADPARRHATFLHAAKPSATLNMMVRYYLVKGRVQGVGFRWFVHQEAAALGLHGWVRNTEEGHVEVVAAGEEEELKDLRLIIGKGSRGSRVDQVDERDLAETEGQKLGPFEIEGAW